MPWHALCFVSWRENSGIAKAMGISIDDALGIHQPALLLRSRRAALLADNLANADTPNYKARDMDFRAELERAIGTPGELSATHPAPSLRAAA